MKQKLRTPTEKPGFLPNLRVKTEYFLKKTRFLNPVRNSYESDFKMPLSNW